MKNGMKLTMLMALGGWLSLAAAPAIETLAQRVQVHRLDNGLTALLVRRANAPVFAAVIQINVGGCDEPAGQTGLAHIFEHIAFKGTPWIGTRDYAAERPLLEAIAQTAARLDAERNRIHPDAERLKGLEEQLAGLQAQHETIVVKDEFDAIYKRYGGESLNASTSKDFTNYFIQLPANAFELWACMESQRLLWPVAREFYRERDVVGEERRMRTDNDPGGKLMEEFFAIAFQAHPYRNPIIGWPSDIQNLDVKAAEAFYRERYAASNITIAVVGDLDADVFRRTIDRYFGRMPRRPVAPRVITREPPPAGPRVATVYFDANPQFAMGWPKPTFHDPDDAALEVLARVLDGGRTTRLEKRIVQEKQLALQVWVWPSAPGEKYDNLFMIWAAPRHPHTAAEVQAAIWEEIERAQKQTVSDREIQRVRNQLMADSVHKLNSNLGLARELAYSAALTGDPLYIDRRLQELLAVTAEDVRRVAARYLVPDRMTLVRLDKRSRAGAE